MSQGSGASPASSRSGGARVAYLITSYVLPDQVLRLARTLRAGSAGAAIVLHHDPRRCRVDAAALDALGVLRIEPPSLVAWGEGSQLEMVLRCLRWAMRSTDADWVVLLSGQDYPIRPVAAIERSLAEARVDGFIHARPVARPVLRSRTVGEFARRYHYHWRRIPARSERVVRAAARARPLVQVGTTPSGTWLGVPAIPSPFGPDLRCHHGGDWFTLSRRAVEAIERFVSERPDVLEHFLRTLIPTEAFVHTVLANEPGLELSGDSRRFTLWDSGAPRPRVLTVEDLPGLLVAPFDFARKFDETVDRAVLDALDRQVHGVA